jgi:hypothetical protein
MTDADLGFMALDNWCYTAQLMQQKTIPRRPKEQQTHHRYLLRKLDDLCDLEGVNQT